MGTLGKNVSLDGTAYGANKTQHSGEFKPPADKGNQDVTGMKRKDIKQDEEDSEARVKKEAKVVPAAKPAMNISQNSDNLNMFKPTTIPMSSSTAKAFSMETHPPPLQSLEEITKAKADLNALGLTFEKILHQIHLIRQMSSLEILSKAGVLEDAEKNIATFTQMAKILGQIAQVQGPITQLQKEVENTTIVILQGRSRL